jgi:hypothetical protein
VLATGVATFGRLARPGGAIDLLYQGRERPK